MTDDPTTARWRQVDGLLEQALEVAEADLGRFLDRACGEDAALRAEIESLLDAEQHAPDVLDRGAIAFVDPLFDDLAAPPSAQEPGPDERLGPYRIVREIGAGGMSRVYLGERVDGELELEVAIKMLTPGAADRSELGRRLRAERQILASFDHPEIARVFDGGVTADGRPYLVMELVAGEPITTYCERRELGLEQRLELFVRVCAAVHYAHQRLVVHRDLKPSNVLATADGIAKLLDPEAPGLAAHMPATRTGLLLLTPEYAAPEQLQGREVTIATDVYALGVMLYELLTGSRPFQLRGKTASQIERVVCEAEPAKPSTAAAGTMPAAEGTRSWPASRLAGDLDTVVLKALRKDPARRYGTARELAAELERFLAGEPVAARPLGTVERWLRKVRRKPRISAAVAATVVLLLVLGGLALQARWSARRQALAAQRFGQEVERIEALLQRAYLAPRHDVRPELARVRRRMARIEIEMADLGPASRAIGAYALGRGYLGLGDEATARAYLEQAWSGGHTEPQVAYALGLALGRLYRSALDELGRIRSPEEREAERQRIERELRDPAVRALEAARVDPGRAALVAASLEFFAGRTETALERLAVRSPADAWFYEADLLAGDIHAEVQRAAAAAGRSELARRAFAEARSAFETAVEVARSDPRGYEGLCSLASDALQQEYYAAQEDLAGLRSAALTTCAQAVETNGDRVVAHLRLGAVERLWADRRTDLGDDPRPLLASARKHLDHAAELAPGDARPWIMLGGLHRSEASFLASRGEDPEAAYDAALASYRRATEIDPANHRAHLSRANAELHLGAYLGQRGGDPSAHFENAVAASQRAVELQPELTGGHVNLGIACMQLALVRARRGAEPEPMLAAGEAALRRAIAINPAFYTAHFNLGQLLLHRAEAELTRGENPSGSVDEAAALLEGPLAAWPDYAPTYLMRAQGERQRARWAMATGGDPEAALAAARGWTDRGAAIGSGNPEVFAGGARAHLLEARWRLGKGASLEPALGRARTLLGRALALHPRHAIAHRLLAEGHGLEAQARIAASLDPRPALRSGLQAVHRAVAENPSDAESHLQAARLDELWASWLRARGEDPTLRAASALAAAERALAQRPGLAEAEAVRERLAATAGRSARSAPAR